MSNPNDIVAVKLEGGFTEWYCPTYKEPFSDHAGYRDYYEKNIIDKQPVVGPVLLGDNGGYVVDDLDCLLERMCACADNSDTMDILETMIEGAMEDGKPRAYGGDDGIGEVKITPYTKAEMPPLEDEALKIFGDYGWLIRERYEAI